MSSNITELRKKKERLFQVLFLDNDDSQVEVEEAEQVDFLSVQRHLKQGGSVFITSKSAQKLTLPKQKHVNQNAKNSEWIIASYFNHA